MLGPVPFGHPPNVHAVAVTGQITQDANGVAGVTVGAGLIFPAHTPEPRF